jgi:hypothetical protein
MDFVLEWPSRAAAPNGDVARRSDHFSTPATITTLDDPNRNAIFTMHLARIDDPRLRRAFRAAVELEEESSRVSSQTKRRALSVSLPR